jgi:HEAT repeat protein
LAGARLAIIGARCVEHLIEALEGDNNRVRARVMPLLALIQDRRGREPLIAMLLDRNARMREVAAQSLARFPSPDAVAALNRTLVKDRDPRVRIAAVHALVEQYSAGQEGAIRLLLPLLVDTAEPPDTRLAACALLRALRPAQRRGIVTRLKRDQDDAIRASAEDLERNAECGDAGDKRVRQLLVELGADDYPTWIDAVRCLGAIGARAVEPLVTEMQARSDDPEYCARAGMVLKSLGPRRSRPMADLLEHVDQALPLQVMVDAIGAMGEKSMIYRLKNLIERLDQRSRRSRDANGFDPLRRVRAKAHLELARIGSRVAIVDLREWLDDPRRRIELELLSAMELIGKREELSLLLRAYAREDGIVRERIAATVQAIMRRERIRRNNRMFHSLNAQQRAALDRIRPPSRLGGRPLKVAGGRPRARQTPLM